MERGKVGGVSQTRVPCASRALSSLNNLGAKCSGLDADGIRI